MRLISQKKPALRLRLRTIFIIVVLSVLLLPIAGIFFFRIYENELVRQTEAELIAQAAFISATYKHFLHMSADKDALYGVPIDSPLVNIITFELASIQPQLDLQKSHVLPPRPEGRPTGVHASSRAIYAGEQLSAIMAEAQQITLSGMKILDYQGIVVAGQLELGLSFSHLPEIQKALQGYYTSIFAEAYFRLPPPALASLSRGTGIRVFIAYPIISNNYLQGVVYLSRTPQNILKHLYAEKEKVFLVSLIILSLAIFIGFITSRMISHPIYRLIEKVKRVTQGEKQAITALSSPGTKEVQALSDSFMKMATHLFDRMDYLQEFAMHISHEFKTPVTSIQGCAELLLDHLDEMDVDERKKFLNNIAADAKRLQLLVSRLLDLARADNVLPGAESTDISQLLAQLQQAYLTKNCQITIENMQTISLAISADNLRMILQNLFDNAMQHGATQIFLQFYLHENRLQIRVTDNGEGISSANQTKLFTPFFTTKRDQNGTGLGLVIIKSLLDKHDGKIWLDPIQPRQGACFIIELPVAGTH